MRSILFQSTIKTPSPVIMDLSGQVSAKRNLVRGFVRCLEKCSQNKKHPCRLKGSSLFKGLSLAACILAIGCSPALAGAPENLCKAAIVKYGVPQGIPLKVLYGISKVESNFRPWAMNLNGRSWYGETSLDLKQRVQKLLKLGHRSFDVGCMQMNVKWHGKRFASVDHLIDPAHNVYQAGKFLKELHDEFGSWYKAVAAYHNRNPKRGQAYLRSVLAAIPSNGVK